MDAITAANVVMILASNGMDLFAKATRLMDASAKAQAEGKTDIPDDVWKDIISNADLEEMNLDATIKQKLLLQSANKG